MSHHMTTKFITTTRYQRTDNNENFSGKNKARRPPMRTTKTSSGVPAQFAHLEHLHIQAFLVVMPSAEIPGTRRAERYPLQSISLEATIECSVSSYTSQFSKLRPQRPKKK
eukprot:TRINITY_DN31466_c0_g1_i1.p1 TRINITY_DN31466_c0_g1~~TRINITY_DN31466_c0_g1_i1.p1  ORF type:complete len:111 (-),score=0.65 TRINITY_DN31466_c0_g1_i1:192-524(-)